MHPYFKLFENCGAECLRPIPHFCRKIKKLSDVRRLFSMCKYDLVESFVNHSALEQVVQVIALGRDRVYSCGMTPPKKMLVTLVIRTRVNHPRFFREQWRP